MVAGLVAGALAWPWYKDVSYWVGPAVALMAITTLHLVFSSPLIVPFPQIAILITGLQYVVAAWLSFYYPPTNPTYDIGNRVAEYLAYGSGATIAFALGWGAALMKSAGGICRPSQASRKLLNELDVLFWFGLFCGLAARFIPFQSLAFLLVLLANLRYVGAFGRMLLLGDGWRWRIGLTLANEVLLATGVGMFHTLLLWAASGFAIYLYRLRPNRGLILLWVLLGGLLLPSFQEAKWKIRENVWYGGTAELSGARPSAFPSSARLAFNWLGYLADDFYRTVTLSWEEEFLTDSLVRYNQGWIINRVMQHVPETEPYARGETLITAAKAAMLPRILAPEKHLSGGRLYMARFAGVELESASMNLGFAGEMYANFGYYGGIGGCFLYAAALGLMVRWVIKRASRAPLWWVFVPYFGVFAIKAEEGIADVLNWLVKGAVIIAAVYFLFPALRAALSTKQQAPEKEDAIPRPSRKRGRGMGPGRAAMPSPSSPEPQPQPEGL